VFPATFFDYNGVLVDDEDVHLEAFREVLAPLGVSVSEEAYWNTYIGFDDQGAFDAILEDAGRPATRAEIADLVEKKKPAYRRRAEGSLKGFAGAADLVRRRAARGPVLVVSGALRGEIQLGLEVLGVSDLVRSVVSAEDTRASKPDPDGYLSGIRLLAPSLGDRSRRTLVVEDSVAGVHSAKAAGLPCVAVTHSYPRERLEQAGADAVTDTLDAITDEMLDALYARLYAP
jgi:HAD superfamily hydrolase (TIGR01509 family)